VSHNFFNLLTFLDDECLLYRLDRAPPDAITITLVLSGERLEITVFENGRIEFLHFVGSDNIGDGGSPEVARLYGRLKAQISN